MLHDYPDEPTPLAMVDSRDYGGILLGENDYGSVYYHGDFGCSDSSVKVAYNIGMHPLESKSHRVLFEVLRRKDGKLRYKYSIYNIMVNKIDEKNEGRMYGQLLARDFVAPHIIDNNYTFFVDVHSNRGKRGPGKYEKTNFIFAPAFDKKSEDIAENILSDIPLLDYYVPEYRTSPEYITIPVAKSGIPTIVYESFSYEKITKTYNLTEKLVECIDNLDFNKF